MPVTGKLASALMDPHTDTKRGTVKVQTANIQETISPQQLRSSNASKYSNSFQGNLFISA
jgi:hypothetical protein